MKVIIAPAGTQTAKAVIRSLLQRHSDTQPIEIQAVYRDLAKVPEEFNSQKNFYAVKGDVGDGGSLDFSGAEAVFTLTPPVFDGRDPIAHAEAVSKNVRNAVEQAESVQRLVLLSSMGAQFSEGVVSIRYLGATSGSSSDV
jgi:uncharacterized protein YbjT (DUF2867 family)